MSLKNEIEKQVKALLDDGIIRPSRSPYNSPVWIVPKKLDASGEKKFRMVIDYRKLNAITIADKYPIPEINEVLAQLGKSKFFTVIDLKSGFHQIPLKTEDIEKTAFSINNGKYEFTRLPFGLKNAPAIFQRALDYILWSHIGERCYVYINDIIIFSPNEEQHIKDIAEVFRTLQEANMKVQLDKCEFFKNEVEFLGFLISQQRIQTNPKKIETIIKFPYPKTYPDIISRSLSKSEENYAANEREMLAIIWSLNTLRYYLYGRARIIIYTDHQPLTYALSNKNNNVKMKRWKAILEEYNYELHYKPGKSNVVADALSDHHVKILDTLTR